MELGLILGGKAYVMASQIRSPPLQDFDSSKSAFHYSPFSLLYSFSFSLQWFG